MSYREKITNSPVSTLGRWVFVQLDAAEEIAARADAEIAKLRAECEGLRADAERYRKLRGMHWSVPRDLAVTDGGSVKLGHMTYSNDRLDAVIDAAMARKGGGEGGGNG